MGRLAYSSTTDGNGEEGRDAVRNLTCADVGVAFVGEECILGGVTILKYANDVIPTEWVNGDADAKLITNVFLVRNGKLPYATPIGRMAGDNDQLTSNGSQDTSGRGERGDFQVSSTSQEDSLSRRSGMSSSSGASVDGLKDSASDRESAPYVVEPPDARKRVLVNEDPFGSAAQVKIEIDPNGCQEGPRICDTTAIGGDKIAPREVEGSSERRDGSG